MRRPYLRDISTEGTLPLGHLGSCVADRGSGICVSLSGQSRDINDKGSTSLHSVEPVVRECELGADDTSRQGVGVVKLSRLGRRRTLFFHDVEFPHHQVERLIDLWPRISSSGMHFTPSGNKAKLLQDSRHGCLRDVFSRIYSSHHARVRCQDCYFVGSGIRYGGLPPFGSGVFAGGRRHEALDHRSLGMCGRGGGSVVPGWGRPGCWAGQRPRSVGFGFAFEAVGGVGDLQSCAVVGSGPLSVPATGPRRCWMTWVSSWARVCLSPPPAPMTTWWPEV